MGNKCITHRQVEKIFSLYLLIGIIRWRQVSTITGTFSHMCLDEALKGDQKDLTDKQPLDSVLWSSECQLWSVARLEIAEYIYNDPSLSTQHVTQSHQVEHCQDNDDRSSDGGQGEAHTWPLYHRLWHSWQPLAPRQLLWKPALQRGQRDDRKDRIKQVWRA